MRYFVLAAIAAVLVSAEVSAAGNARSRGAKASVPAASALPAAPSDAGGKQAPARPAAAEQEQEETGVVVDGFSGQADAETAAEARGSDEQPVEEAPRSSSIPASYGKLSGVINEQGRTLLVFESDADGAISFVQVTVGRNSLSWKLIARAARSQD